MEKTALTPRERQIAEAVAAGHTNARIARKLGLREQTIKNRLSVIYHKYGVRSRLELAVLALRTGSIGTGDSGEGE